MSDGAVVPAGEAERLALLGGHHPVAGIALPVLAEAIVPIRIGECDPVRTVRLDRAQSARVGKIAQPVAAFLAGGVFEVEDLPAVLAFEELHVRSPRAS